ESKKKKAEASVETSKGSRKKMHRRKRARKQQQQESSKKQRMEEDKESDEVEEVSEDDEVDKSRWKLQEILFNDKDATRNNDTSLEDEFERVLWGDLKVTFEPDITSDVWGMLQRYRVTIWKLIDSSRVHFVRFDNLHIFMLVEKRYPLTPITITNMLTKKLQTDHQNEMCYLLLKLMVKQKKVNERFECIPPEYDEEFVIKKLEDSEAKHQVYGKTVER
ncbi:hypothetical protein Tco_0063786, partial [Tanacetum coccineum]